MNTPKHPITDKEIILMIRQKDKLAWQFLHNMYSAILYGAILRIVGDEVAAEAILVSVFAGLKENASAILSSRKPLCLFLLHYVYGASVKTLNGGKETAIVENKRKTPYPFLNRLIYKPESVAEIAQMNVLTEREVKLRLRSELNEFRSKPALSIDMLRDSYIVE